MLYSKGKEKLLELARITIEWFSIAQEWHSSLGCIAHQRDSRPQIA